MHERKRWTGAVVVIAAAFGVAACAVMMPGKPVTGGEISKLPAMTHPADNPSTPAKVALGAQLFLDKRLSGNQTMACQGCHYRELGWTDAKVLSRRPDGSMNTRHTPGLYNVGYQTLWYWDGRAASLESQILAAWRNQLAVDPAVVPQRLSASPEYVKQFQDVFGTAVTTDGIVKALAAYLRTKVSNDSPWDKYERGDTKAVSADAIEGWKLFMEKGRCAACHTPPHYGNSTFFNIGLEAGKPNPDPGRFNVTRVEQDRGAFKTPSLRSVALSAPYFHDGSAATLTEAVRYMANGHALRQPQDPNKSGVLAPNLLTEPEIAKVVEFLKTLTSTETWTAAQVPK